MAYAYLFKYIIIGDTGEAAGEPWRAEAGRRGKRRRWRGWRGSGGAERRGASLPPILPRSPGRRSISAVLALMTWALRAAAAWPGPSSLGPGPLQPGLGQPFAAPGEGDSRAAQPGTPAWTVSAARGGRGKPSESERDGPRSGFLSPVPPPRLARFRLGLRKAHPEVGQPVTERLFLKRIFFFLKRSQLPSPDKSGHMT